ncbi:MAG: gluconate 2-dehydrogenase subunit 3 family protein [Deltaproteobacteria bacterium]|nr:gluconate 2-dehydrogenase subunit 3 family protein [Deltaproteobacteria bacterium]
MRGDEGVGPGGWSRRRFLEGAARAVAGLPLAGLGIACARAAGGRAGDDAGPDPGPDPAAEAQGDPGGDAQAGPVSMSAARFAVLSAAVDALIPGDEAVPGAAIAGAASYVDGLLSAFAHNPPRVYAGGPYSGRHGGLDGFSRFIPLTRVEEIAWRTRIEGSAGRPEREFNGPVKGWVARYEKGLDALDAAARGAYGGGFADLGLDDRRAVLGAADGDFVKLAYDHACEGTYGDPVYGGNRDRAGWKGIGYEGDRQPVGYTARQMSHPEEG